MPPIFTFSNPPIFIQTQAHNLVETTSKIAFKDASSQSLDWLIKSGLKLASHAFFPKKSPRSSFQFLHLDFHKAQAEGLSNVKRLLEALKEHHPKFTTQEQKIFAYLGVMELLCKNLAYSRLKEGACLPLPVKTSDGDIHWVDYRLDKIFYLGGTVPAYGLVPLFKKAPPILLFRGTTVPSIANFFLDQASIKTWEADLDSEGVGKKQIEQIQESLCQWLQDKKQAATLIGHSLGGAYAHQAAVCCHQYVSDVITFNAPLVRKELKNRYDAIEKPPHILNFTSAYDPISKFGGGYLLGEGFEISKVKGASKDVHSGLVFLVASSFCLQTIDVKRANQSLHLKFSDSWHDYLSEKVAHTVGKYFFHLTQFRDALLGKS